MAELHPFFVHFPIALLFVAVFFDLYSVLRKHEFSRTTAYALQVMAALSSIFAAITGNQAETALVKQEALTQSVSDIFNRHVSFGNAAVWIIVIVVIGRTFAILEKKSWAQGGWLFPLISLGLGLLILTTGLLGGELSRSILDYFILN